MNWTRLGFLIQPKKELWWMQTHAMIPTLEYLGDDLCKVYFSGRDKDNRSHIGWVLVNLNNPTKYIDMSPEPILAPGSLGCFDDNGVTPSCILSVGDEKFLYYIGWNPGSTTRMHIYGGLAISNDGGKSFTRYSRAPIIERCRVNPYINTAPFVLKDETEFKMYYVSGVEWVHRDLPRYNIQLATSLDGKEWTRKGHVCIDFENGENALARPFVIKENNLYKMWFSSKGDAYDLHYAESYDGLHWTRTDDKFHFPRKSSGSDSEMMEYAAVIKHKDSMIMFYNGNNYGAEGILVAKSES